MQTFPKDKGDLLILTKYICVMARGSLSETVNHLIDALDECYIQESILIEFKRNGKEIERILNGYRAFLRKKRDVSK